MKKKLALNFLNIRFNQIFSFLLIKNNGSRQSYLNEQDYLVYGDGSHEHVE